MRNGHRVTTLTKRGRDGSVSPVPAITLNREISYGCKKNSSSKIRRKA